MMNPVHFGLQGQHNRLRVRQVSNQKLAIQKPAQDARYIVPNFRHAVAAFHDENCRQAERRNHAAISRIIARFEFKGADGIILKCINPERHD